MLTYWGIFGILRKEVLNGCHWMHFHEILFFVLHFMNICRPERRIPKLIMDWTARERRKRGRPGKT